MVDAPGQTFLDGDDIRFVGRDRLALAHAQTPTR